MAKSLYAASAVAGWPVAEISHDTASIIVYGTQRNTTHGACAGTDWRFVAVQRWLG